MKQMRGMIVKYLKLFAFLILIELLSQSLFARDISVSYDRFYVVSIPKCGTNLLAKCVHQITKRFFNQVDYNDHIIVNPVTCKFGGTRVLVTHFICDKRNIEFFKKFDAKGIFIYRDPRDQIISFAYFIQKIDRWPHLKKLSMSELIMKLITDISMLYGPKGFVNSIWLELKGVDSYYLLYLDWRLIDEVYATTFEKLVGKQGGGSDELQFLEIKNIALHLGYNLSNDEIKEIQSKLFGGTWTFREGKIGSWKEHFTLEHKKAFKKVAGQLLIDLGYEKDLNW